MNLVRQGTVTEKVEEALIGDNLLSVDSHRNSAAALAVADDDHLALRVQGL